MLFPTLSAKTALNGFENIFVHGFKVLKKLRGGPKPMFPKSDQSE